jgi:predicted nucleic acid-binding protein
LIAYFDTSAVVPLVVEEPGSEKAGTFWDSADRIVSARLVYPEARAALAQANRLDRLTAPQLRSAVRQLNAMLADVDIVEIDEDLAAHAGQLAEDHALRGYDAVHLAAALRLEEPELVLVAGDAALLGAADRAGLMTAATLN